MNLSEGLSLFSLGSGIGQGIFNTTSKLGLKRQLRYYNKAADADMQRKISLWNMENDYNKPSAQMARYKDAGLNPNLIYGTGSASAGNATGFPTVGGQKFDFNSGLDLSSGFSSYAQMRMLKSNIDVNKSVIDRNDAAAAKDNAIARNYDDLTRTQIEEINSRISRNETLNDLNLSQTEHQRLVNDILSATKDNQILLSNIKVESERTALNTALYNLQHIAPLVAAKYRVDIDHINKEIDELESRIGLNKANAAAAYSMALLNAARRVNQEIANAYAEDKADFDLDPAMYQTRVRTYAKEWLSRQSRARLQMAEEDFRNKYGWFPVTESIGFNVKAGPVSVGYQSSGVETVD